MAPEVAAQLARLESVDAAISSRAGAVLREWVAAGQAIGPLVDHYLRVTSAEALTIMTEIKEPYDEILITKVNEMFRRVPLETLALLLKLMQHAPPWLRQIPKHPIFPALIERLKYDKIKTHADVELAIGILNILAGLVPHCIDLSTAQLEGFFVAFTKGAIIYTTLKQNQTTAPINFDVSISRIQATALYAALTNLFEFLYASYPCNFAGFIRKQNEAHPSQTFFARVLEPMSKAMRLNPKLLIGSCQKELNRGDFEEAFAVAECLSFHDVPPSLGAQPSLSTTSSVSSLRMNMPTNLGSASIAIATTPAWSPLQELPARPMTYVPSSTMNTIMSDTFRPRVASATTKPPPTKKVSIGERVNNFFKGTDRKYDVPSVALNTCEAATEDAFCPYASSFIDRRDSVGTKSSDTTVSIPVDPIQPRSSSHKTGSKRRRCTSDPCGCRQHAFAENLDPVKFPYTIQALQVSKRDMITDTTLARLTSTAANVRSEYLTTAGVYQNMLLQCGILVSPESEFAALESLKVEQQRDILLMRARLYHQHLLFERYCRIINACRNTHLYDQLRDAHAVFGERDALKEQISALKAELCAKDAAANEIALKSERERAERSIFETSLKAKMDDLVKERDVANARIIELQLEFQQLSRRDADLRAARDNALIEKDNLLAEYRFVNDQLNRAQLGLMRNIQLERRCQVLSKTVQTLTQEVLETRGRVAESVDVVRAPTYENVELRKQLSKIRRELRSKRNVEGSYSNRVEDAEWLLSVEGAMDAALSVFEVKQMEQAKENIALRETNTFYLNHIYELKAELESERKHRIHGCYADKTDVSLHSPIKNVDMSVISGLFANTPVKESPDNTPYYKSCIFGLDDDDTEEGNENDPGDLDESIDVPNSHFTGNWGATGDIPKGPTANSSTFNYDVILNNSTATAAFQMQHPAARIGYRQHDTGKLQSPK